VAPDDSWVQGAPRPVPRPEEDKSNPAVEQQHAREFHERRQMIARAGGLPAETWEVPRSRYGDREDRVENGHTAVFGSYWEGGRWGYACCRQLTRGCTCTRKDV
jgi:hypothetical protein